MNGVKGGSVNRVLVDVWDSGNAALSGDAGNLTISLSLDGAAAVTSTNAPTEIGATGHYQLLLTAAESNADFVAGAGVSSTSGARVICESMSMDASVDLTKIGGDLQSGTDLKDFSDEGYDPATNQVNGVKLVDTTTDVTNAVDSNLVEIGGDAQSATDLKDFADDGYDPATDQVNGVKLVATTTDVTNEIKANLVQVLGTDLTETNAADLANNISFFFDVNPTTTNTVDDVGGGGGGTDWTSGERDEIRYRLQMDGVQSAPSTDAPEQLPATADVNLGTTELNQIADTVLTRNMSFVEDTAPKHSLTALVLANTNSTRNDVNATIDVFETTGDLFNEYPFTSSDVNPLTSVT